MLPVPCFTALFVAAVLALGACGEEDGAEDQAPYDITVGEFIGLIQPEKQEVLEAFVAQSEACQDVKADPSFTLVVTAAGLDAEQESSLPELIEDQC
ncbi:MAG: hypothetical protein M3383_04475 [Actinomycetota bacterium]|nr:hypothetical protein [Actinomycetota bacterium]